MIRQFSILLVEDSPQDAELEERELRQAGFAFRSHRVDSAPALRQALEAFKPDIVVSDYSLPAMNGLEALRIVREADAEIPFIFASGTIGEELATDSLKRGATDYVVKGRRGGLAAKVERALLEYDERRERRRLGEQLRQAQKMEAIGRLAGGIAHDFNNLLTVINGFGELLFERMKDHPDVRADLEQVLGAGRRAAELTRQLLAFSRKQVTQLVPVDLNALITSLGRMIGRIVGEDVELDLKLDPNLHPVAADPGQIEQVLMNLVVNARDAMPLGGRIAIATRKVELGGDRPGDGRKAGPYVVLTVSDTGTGMSEETLAHLFEPFFTTKEPGKGTGLGLSSVHGIVRQHKGHLEVASELGKGSRFEIYLPKADLEVLIPPEARSPAPRPRGTETILFAEDSDTVRLLCEKILQSAGYRLLPARDGHEALSIAKSISGPIHLLVSDTVMPGMNGAELAVHVSRQCPGVRVLFITGYTDENLELKEVRSLGAAFLQKPFSKDAFLAKIREVLDAP